MIVLKHLAQEFKLDPRKLRQRLREKFGRNRRWQWVNEDDPMLLEVRSYLQQLQMKKASPRSCDGTENTT